jgi:sugar/nucleoside kinase (ribokinase family)
MNSSSERVANVYLFGMTVWSTIHRLEDRYPEADRYAEIAETHLVPGGEAGNSALVLNRWGHHVKIAGPFLGSETRDKILAFFSARGIDTSSFEYDTSFAGVRDLVLVDGATRTVFGRFGEYFRGPKRWSKPKRADVAAADIVGIDPFFGDESVEAGRLCRELGKPYVTIDCPPDSELHRHAAANVVSNEFLTREFPGKDHGEILTEYTREGAGLVIFTYGARKILFARGNQPARETRPFSIVPKSTLGAGDTFRGGVMHGILCGWDDARVVRFAAATAACVCLRFPMADDPPTLQEIEALIGRES